MVSDPVSWQEGRLYCAEPPVARREFVPVARLLRCPGLCIRVEVPYNQLCVGWGGATDPRVTDPINACR